ncbi:hypothetical protein NE683_06925 [Bariatricus massiliensis]|uniref:Uncharacterized protein n=1 Tax=Bariatricus massiliensis TaxID=1745713 RepID=A0ABS8DBY3_9FIRM|nr:hypothetical protein [Bariatricus massiliensis]MCB7303820.1 hypothetical protein [Bariatricus massiliensis]MCB7373236.1 hypothetical protein [Bariatricus massiliensis]MCB7385906.1 hypothetical protein [Bariatricus massiliensis]MCB7410068.1 hypothetical protein [Bariatricus massiliensis]MCQ5252964.1 hypothetical protein [Bariatricus massiliensis]
MRFYKYLYVSDSMVKRKKKTVKHLRSGKYPIGTYIIVLIEEGPNQLEFYNTALLKQKLLDDRRQFVVGLASGYDDAVYLVEEIVRDVFENTGDADIRAYIMKQEGREK